MAFLALLSMKPESNARKAYIIQKADPVKEKYTSAITGGPKAAPAYCRMQKRASGSGSGEVY